VNSCWPDTDVIKSNLTARYRQKVKNEMPGNGACELALVIIDVLLELTAQILLANVIGLYGKASEVGEPSEGLLIEFVLTQPL